MAGKISKASKAQMSEDAKRERRWKVEGALSTIQRYNEIIEDKSLMKEVAKEAKKTADLAIKVQNSFLEKSKEIKFGK